MKRFVTSDSHGGYKALVQCLERCGFIMDKDQLIFIGDSVDGWPESKESLELLLSVRNLVYLLGNHDQWALQYYSGEMDANDPVLRLWLSQGGAATIESYGAGKSMPPEHLQLLEQAKLYHITPDNLLFVHAGYDPAKPIEETPADNLLWDRNFVMHNYQRYKAKLPVAKTAYKEVYIGHTPTIALNKLQTTPLQMSNIILTDTGAAFTGSLSIMNIDSKDIWQSDPVMKLYPEQPGRNGISWNDIYKMS